MRKLTKSRLLLFLGLLSASVNAQTVFPELSGEELKQALIQTFRPEGILDYSDARFQMFQIIDNRNDTVYGIYSNHSVWLDPEAPDPIQFLLMNNNPDGINTEHIFPQSQGAGSGNARADLHHLFPARVRVNESRGSFPYAEIDDQQTEHWYYLNQDMTNIPDQMIDLYSEQLTGFFEPRESKKGDVARAMFYFFTMYSETTNPDFFLPQVETLCQWHVDDPIDGDEAARNDAVAAFQENKPNPFILDCTVADRTYCAEYDLCKPNSVVRITKKELELSPNPAAYSIRIESNLYNLSARFNIVDLTGKVWLQGLHSATGSVEIHSLPVGMYIFRIIDRSTFTHGYGKFVITR